MPHTVHDLYNIYKLRIAETATRIVTLAQERDLLRPFGLLGTLTGCLQPVRVVLLTHILIRVFHTVLGDYDRRVTARVALGRV